MEGEKDRVERVHWHLTEGWDTTQWFLASQVVVVGGLNVIKIVYSPWPFDDLIMNQSDYVV